MRQQAEVNLIRHGITEPVTWEPPALWVTWTCWPGADPAGITRDGLTTVPGEADSVRDAASTLGLTCEHVRLFCETAGTGAAPAAADGATAAQGRAAVLDRVRLRELYEDQHVPLAEIAAMAGCGTATIRTLLQMDGVPRRFRNRRPAPGSGITRAWLEREYVVKLRSIGALARARGVTAAYLMSLARNWGLPIRRRSQFSGIGDLNLPVPPSPAMRAVTMRTGALDRLELITQIPGHASIAAAARAIYGGRTGALTQKVHKIETAAGFVIINRSSAPLAPTAAGCEFIQEALQILQIAQQASSA